VKIKRFRAVRSRCYQYYKRASFWGVRTLQVALSPAVIIRIDTIYAARIGHLISETEQVLGQVDPNLTPRRVRNIFVIPEFVCNGYLLEKYIELLRQRPNTTVCHSKFGGRFSPLAFAGGETRGRVFTGAESDRWYCGPRTDGGQFMANEPLPLKPSLSFSAEFTLEGSRILESVGFTLERPLVCLHIRDSAYLRESQPRGGDWSYHDYRDPLIGPYEELARYLLNEGYSVVRTGNAADKRMSIEDPNFLDYPFSNVKSDWMDVFLYSVCNFAVSGGLSGIDQLPMLMRKPVIVCDLAPLFLPTYRRDLSILIFSRMRWRDSGIDLTLRESLNNVYFTSDEFNAAGIELVRNSAQELIEATQELISLGGGEVEISGVRPSREESFWKIFGEKNQALACAASSPEFFPRIGWGFLQRHAEALDLE